MAWRVGRPRPGVVGWLLIAVALGFGLVALVGRWHDISTVSARLSLVDLLLAGAAAAVGMLLVAVSWRAVLSGMQQHLPLRESLAVFTAAQLGKYVPGTVWVMAIQADLGRRWRVPASVMALSYVVGTVVAIATGALMALTAATDPARPLAPALLVAVCRRRAGAPRGTGPAAAAQPAHQRGRSPAAPGPAGGRAGAGRLARAVVWECLGWIALGLQLWLLARPLGASAALIPAFIGIFALAFVVGLVLIPLPAGLGVREGLLVVLLAPSLGAGAALTVALLSRLVLVAVDLVLASVIGGPGLLRRVRAGSTDDPTGPAGGVS